VAQAHEAGEMVAWLHSSAAARLPPAAAVGSALRDGAPDAATAPPHPAVLEAAGGRLLPGVPALLAAWAALKSRRLYRGLMEALEHALSHARTAHAGAEVRPETATTAAAATAAAAAAAAATAAAIAAAASDAKEARRRGRVEAAAALLRATQPLAEAAATCGEFVDAAREQCALLDSPLPEERPQPEEPEQDAHAHVEPPEPLGVLGEAVGASGLPDSYEAFERAEHSSLRRAHEEICASELGTRVRDWRRAMCALHAALAPHALHLDALRTQLRWCVVHLQRLAEQLRRADGELLGAATSGSVSGETYESAVYGRISNDGLMSTR
jgi:hypothetical protein